MDFEQLDFIRRVLNLYPKVLSKHKTEIQNRLEEAPARNVCVRDIIDYFKVGKASNRIVDLIKLSEYRGTCCTQRRKIKVAQSTNGKQNLEYAVQMQYSLTKVRPLQLPECYRPSGLSGIKISFL
jgi:hypothetical protein